MSKGERELQNRAINRLLKAAVDLARAPKPGGRVDVGQFTEVARSTVEGLRKKEEV